MYQLIRTLPDGVEKYSTPRASKRAAALSAGLILHDNVGTPKSEAQRFSKLLEMEPEGSEWCHTSSGYWFRIERVEE